LSKLKKLGKKILSKNKFVDGLFRRFIWSKIHYPEIEMLLLYKSKNNICDISVDVGAALGSYTWIFSRISKSVYSFEPGSSHYNYLKPLNFFSNINFINCAAGSSNIIKKLFIPGSDTYALHTATLSENNPIVNQSQFETEEVEVVTLDHYFNHQINSFSRSIDLLKVDVEGYEFDVFKGAENLINKFHPLVICEIEYRHNVHYKMVFEFFIKLDYFIYYFKNSKFHIMNDFDLNQLQNENDLDKRLSGKFNANDNTYINNFVFQHKNSKFKLID